MKDKETLEIVKESRKAGMQAAYIVFASMVCLLIGVLLSVYIIRDYHSTSISAKASNGNNYIQSK